jgi:hypothetical protein
MFIARALAKKACAGGNDDLVAFERLHKCKLVRCEVAQGFA